MRGGRGNIEIGAAIQDPPTRQEDIVKITAIETIFVDRYLFVKVHTDEGITGLGESGAWGYLEASAGRRRDLQALPHRPGPAAHRAPLAVPVPLDPLPRRGDHGRPQRHRHRALGHRRQALRRARATSSWAARRRDKARVYYHVFGETKEELVAGLHRRQEARASPPSAT